MTTNSKRQTISKGFVLEKNEMKLNSMDKN